MRNKERDRNKGRKIAKDGEKKSWGVGGESGEQKEGKKRRENRR